jgi:hypothetical protein
MWPNYGRKGRPNDAAAEPLRRRRRGRAGPVFRAF